MEILKPTGSYVEHGVVGVEVGGTVQVEPIEVRENGSRLWMRLGLLD